MAPAALAEHSVLPQLWVPVAILSHLFAAIWLIRTFQLIQPATWAKLTAALGLKNKRQMSRTGCKSPQAPGTTHLTADGSSATSLATEDIWGSESSSTDDNRQNQEATIDDATETDSDLEHHAVAVVCTPMEAPLAIAADMEAQQFTQKQLKHRHHTHLKLTWRSIGCTYKTAEGIKPVLQDIWGEATAGEMQALIGPSGAGKSSLLDILACRKATGSVSGTVLLNGQLVQRSSYTRRIAYVPQDDNFNPVMTCLEVLLFHAAMQLPHCHQRQQSGELEDVTVEASSQPTHNQQQWQHVSRRLTVGQAAVQQVLTVVGLPQHASTLVGGRLPGGLLLRGLSSGERRRLGIAVGILANPDILFLDEPTSGLDSFAALSVMSHLQSLAHTGGKAVLAAIHQPRSAIWRLFDKVTLLASGLLLYHGPAPGMVPWLSGQLGYSYNPVHHGLESDWALDLVVVEFDKPKAFKARTMTTLAELQTAADMFKLQYICDHLQDDPQPLPANETGPTTVAAANSSSRMSHGGPFSRGGSIELPEAQQQRHHMAAQQQQQPPHPASSDCTCQQGNTDIGITVGSTSCSSHRTSWLQQYKALAWRELLKITRNPADVAGRTLTFTWIALMVGLVYYDLSIDASSIRQRLNLLFATLCFFVLMPFVNMSLYTEDKGAYLADKAAKLYAPSAYYLAKVSVSLPFQVFTAITASMVQYGMTGLRHGAASVFMHCSIGTVTSLIAIQVLHFAATVTPSQDAAFMMGIMWTTSNLVMSGFFIPYKEIRFSVLSNLRYLSALHYAFEGFVQTELGGRQFVCPAEGISSQSATFVTQLLPGTAALVTPARLQQISAAQQGCTVNSNAIPEYFGFTRDFGTTIGILIGYLGVVHVFTFLALLLVAKKERRRTWCTRGNTSNLCKIRGSRGPVACFRSVIRTVTVLRAVRAAVSDVDCSFACLANRFCLD